MNHIEDGKSGHRKLFYVPVSIKMIMESKGEECLIDNHEIKSVNHKVIIGCTNSSYSSC